MLQNLVTYEELQPVLNRLDRLEKETTVLRRLAKKNVGTEEAMEVTGLSRSQLDYQRTRKDSLIKWGKEGTKVLYELQSLIHYNDSKSLSIPDNILKIA